MGTYPKIVQIFARLCRDSIKNVTLTSNIIMKKISEKKNLTSILMQIPIGVKNDHSISISRLLKPPARVKIFTEM